MLTITSKIAAMIGIKNTEFLISVEKYERKNNYL